MTNTSDEESMRLFVAHNASEVVRSNIAEFTQELQDQLGGVKWTDPEKFHVTLKFLGDVPRSKLPEVKEILRNEVSEVDGATVQVQGLGSFPERGTPRVFWVGFRSGEVYRDLHQLLDPAYAQLGIDREEREFHPHITLGRVKDSQKLRRGDWKTILERESSRIFGEQDVHRVTLIESTLTSEGPEYTHLEEVPLKR